MSREIPGYQRISSLTDSIVVVDDEGHRATFETLEAYEIFRDGLAARGLTLFDDTKPRASSSGGQGSA
jgi:hypothetical protein